MTQEQIVVYLVVSYSFSSFVGAILFTVMWRLSHKDRVGLKEVPPDGRLGRLRNSAAWRNEYIGAVMALAFWLYTCAATIGIIRTFELIQLPWVEGLVTITLLVIGNFVEMTVAVALVYARIQMNRDSA